MAPATRLAAVPRGPRSAAFHWCLRHLTVQAMSIADVQNRHLGEGGESRVVAGENGRDGGERTKDVAQLQGGQLKQMKV